MLVDAGPDPGSASRSGCPGGTTVVHEMADVEKAAEDGLIRGVVIPFNGVLVTRELVGADRLPARGVLHLGRRRRVPLARRGGRRPHRHGRRRAHVLHPATDDLGTPMMFGRTTYNHSPSDLKHYCMARNNTVNLRRYRRLAARADVLGQDGVVLPAHQAATRRRLPMSARAAYAGLRGDFTGHRRYLR